MIKLILVILSLYILSGCATTAQNQYKRIEAQLKSTAEAGHKCFAQIKDSPIGQRLQERFILDARDPRSVEKLTITGYATEQEIKDILEHAAIKKPCQNQVIDELGQVHPGLREIFARGWAERDRDKVKVIKKELTVAEVNQRHLDRVNQATGKIFQALQRIDSELNLAHQQQVAARQRAWARAGMVLRQWAYQQQQLEIQRQRIRSSGNMTTTRCRETSLTGRNTTITCQTH
jgi:hypothetical protein